MFFKSDSALPTTNTAEPIQSELTTRISESEPLTSAETQEPLFSDEMLLTMFSHMAPQTLIVFSGLSQHCYSLTHDQLLWRHKFSRYFPDVSLEKNDEPYVLFWETNRTRHKRLSPNQKLLHAHLNDANEILLYELKKDLTLDDLMAKDSAGVDALMLVHSHIRGKRYTSEEEKAVLSIIFQIAEPYFLSHRQDKRGHQLAHWFILCGKLRKEELLPYVPLLDEDGNTLLHLASYYGMQETIDFLLEHMDIDITNKQGRTPFLHALHHGNLQIARYLIDKGAKKGFTDTDGNNLFHIAADSADLNIIQYLFSLYTEASETEVATLLAKQNSKGETPLHRVFCHIEGSNDLVEKQELVDSTLIEIVKHFCQGKADTTIEDKRCYTPLTQVIFKCSNVNILPIIEILANNGAFNKSVEKMIKKAIIYDENIINILKCRRLYEEALEELSQNSGTRMHFPYKIVPALFYTAKISVFENILSSMKTLNSEIFEKYLYRILINKNLNDPRLEAVLNSDTALSTSSPRNLLKLATLIYERRQDRVETAIELLERCKTLGDKSESNTASKLLSSCKEIIKEKAKDDVDNQMAKSM